MDGCMDRKVGGWIDGRMDSVWVKRQVDGWMMTGWMDRSTDPLMHLSMSPLSCRYT